MKNNNQINVPLISRGYGPLQDAYQASEVGVNLRIGNNASLTSREASDLGTQMAKRCVPYESQNSRETTEFRLGMCRK